jgi:YVTN family beta-propeller protein
MKLAKMLLLANCGILALILSIAECQGQSKNYLLTLSKADHVMAMVDPVSLKIISRIPVGSDPHEVIASSDGKLAFVTNTNGGRGREINVIDLVSQKALANVDTKSLLGPHGIVFEGGKAWFSAEGSKAVGRYDPLSSQIDWSMGTGQDRTHMIFVSPDEKRIYTTNVNAGTVSILVDTLIAPGPTPMGAPPAGTPPRREWVHTVVNASKGCEGFDVSPDGRYLWTVAAGDGSITVIDVMTKKALATIDAKVLGANRLKFTPDGKSVLISSLRIGDLFIYDVASRKELKRINIGKGGAGILVDPDGTRAFVGCTPDNYVAVVDLKKLELVNKISLGGPDGLAWAT